MPTTATTPSTVKIRPCALVRASGGPRYAVALAVDALGTGLLRPFLLLYGAAALRGSLAAATLVSSAAVAKEKDAVAEEKEMETRRR